MGLQGSKIVLRSRKPLLCFLEVEWLRVTRADFPGRIGLRRRVTVALGTAVRQSKCCRLFFRPADLAPPISSPTLSVHELERYPITSWQLLHGGPIIFNWPVSVGPLTEEYQFESIIVLNCGDSLPLSGGIVYSDEAHHFIHHTLLLIGAQMRKHGQRHDFRRHRLADGKIALLKPQILIGVLEMQRNRVVDPCADICSPNAESVLRGRERGFHTDDKHPSPIPAHTEEDRRHPQHRMSRTNPDNVRRRRGASHSSLKDAAV